MITQHQLDTIAENLAAELNLGFYDHLVLSEIVQGQLNQLIDDMTKYPSRYFSAGGDLAKLS